MKLNGLVGGGTGKLGNSVFSQNAGRTIVRQYQSEVKNPNTARQQEARARFIACVSISKGLASILAVGMPRVGALTSRNLWLKQVLSLTAPYKDVVTGNAEEGFDFTAAACPVAKGGMPMPNITTAALNQQGTAFEVTLASNYDPEAAGYVPPMAGQAGIVIALLAENVLHSTVKQFSTVEAGTLTVPVPADLRGDTVAVYVFGKWIPASRTTISTTTEPWKYPSDQSDSRCVAEAMVS